MHPLSHFTIRVNPAIRQSVRQRLWKNGIDVGTLFPFPSYVSANDFPNTKNVTSEILNLPLDPRLTFDAIDRISERVLAAVGSFETKHEPVLLEGSHD
jgi:dTDP-4-amino-4,6-dideoxygalactose transaminase